MKNKEVRLVAIFSALIVVVGFLVVYITRTDFDELAADVTESFPILTASSTDAPSNSETNSPSALFAPSSSPGSLQSPVPSQSAAPTDVPFNQLMTNPPTPTSPPDTEMSDQQILDMLRDAVNKTKAYSSPLSVHHSESFQANVTDCTGGALVARVVNSLMGAVVKPVDEMLSFDGGTAVDSEGEQVTILLPQKGNFRLEMSGVSAISSSKEGENTVIRVELVPESVGIDQIPTANAAGVGFLDVSTIDISFLEVTKADIDYSGSTIKAVINPQGYVIKAEYVIPLHVEGAASAGAISGYATFDGSQAELWELNF